MKRAKRCICKSRKTGNRVKCPKKAKNVIKVCRTVKRRRRR